MNPKISVIIPVYNAERYIADTLDSVISGSFSDFEVVAVNDGSTDSSLRILTSYAERDGRIRVIDKPNTGVSDTRNVAIAEAKGEYLAFLDSDDIYSPEYLERMYSAAEKSGADVIVCGYVTFRGEKPVFPDCENGEVRTTDIRELLDTGLMTSMCVKLVKKSVVQENNIAFDKNLAFGEDLFFSWRVCLSSNATVKIEDKLYGYRMSAAGATARYHGSLYEKYKAAFDSLKEYASLRGASEEAIRDIDIYFVKRLPTLSFMTARSKQSFGKKRRYISGIISDPTVRNITENHFDELTRGESEKGVSLYKAAAKKQVLRVLMYGVKMEYRLKLSRLKGRIGERRRDKK
ncbi:MAG: glycosyltransferase family 2 protein [Clostridia bacterium]|nr:glycosyltransferase family 2 protein [Clostridia bacterium]